MESAARNVNWSVGGDAPAVRRNLTPLAIIVGSFGVMGAIFVPFLSPALRRICLPYVPASSKQLENITSFIKSSLQQNPRNSETLKLVDLGSGDGRVVFACAAAVASQSLENNKPILSCTGVELNYWLTLYSRIKALSVARTSRPKFQRCDLFKIELSQYDFVVLFGVESMMQAVVEKLEHQLPDNAYFIACRFPLPSKYASFDLIGKGIDKVWIYRGSDLKRGKNSSVVGH